MKKIISIMVVTAFMTSFLSGCASMNNTQQGAGVGAGLGAITGALVAKNKLLGAVIGGAVGAIIGMVVGNYMDKQTATRAQAAQKYYSNTVVPQDQLVIEDCKVVPTPVKQGATVESRVNYTALKTDESQKVAIIETRTLISESNEATKLSERSIEKLQGSYQSNFKFKVPNEIDPGNYTLVTTVICGDQRQSVKSPITII
jgi:hypothetical protein